jgi:hypothetical protein
MMFGTSPLREGNNDKVSGAGYPHLYYECVPTAERSV